MKRRNVSREVLRYAKELGYLVKPAGSGHFKAKHPLGPLVILSGSINESHGKHEKGNLERALRRIQK